MAQKNINFEPLKDLAKIKFGQMWVIAVVFFIFAMGALVVGALLQVDLSFLPTLGILAIIILSFYQGREQAKKNKLAISGFANANSWQFSPAKMVTDKAGSVFSIGHGRVAHNIISGTLQNLPFDTYAYSYTVGSGKSQRVYDLQVFELTLPRKLPHMVIDSLVEGGNGSASTLPIEFSQSQKIELEGDFSQYFSLYAPDKYGITALTVLAPDAMEALMQHAAKCDIEIINNKLYFYWPDTASNKKMYEEIFSSVTSVLAKTIDKLTTSDIFATDKQSSLHATATARGARLKRSWWNKRTNVSVVVAIVLGASFLSGNFLSVGTTNTLQAIFFLVLVISLIVSFVASIVRAIVRGQKQRELTQRKF